MWCTDVLLCDILWSKVLLCESHSDDSHVLHEEIRIVR